MNKKKDQSEVLAKRSTIRYTAKEYEIVRQRANDAEVSFSEFCRQMTIKGYVQAVHSNQVLSEIMELKSLLINYKTNFSRISNLIKEKDPNLNNEVKQLRDSLQILIDKIRI
jgi:hypothetical protein